MSDVFWGNVDHQFNGRWPLRLKTQSYDDDHYFVELSPMSSIDTQSLHLAQMLFDRMCSHRDAPKFIISFARPAYVGTGTLQLLKQLHNAATMKSGYVHVNVDDDNVMMTLKLTGFDKIVPVCVCG